MKKSNLLLGIFVLAFVLFCGSCKQNLDDTPLENMVTIADFTNGEDESFFPSNGWCNGEPFNVTWNENNVSYENGAAQLFITEEDDVFYGGELRSNDHFHYGDYEISMKPEAKVGTCTSFFVYTGPSETDENGNPNPHDEIDIEFLGKDTTYVQFNFFVNGKGGNEYKYDLGFDASEEFHTYGFRWTETYITWYVDGKPVYRVNETKSKPLPETPGRMMMNYWCGTKQAELWMSRYDHPAAGEASEYKLIKTSATPIVEEVPTEEPTKTPEVNTGIDWSSINALANLPAESSDGTHTITTNETAYNVVYSNVSGGTYNNVKFNLDDSAKNMNYLYLKATNNSEDSTVNVRVDVYGNATRKTTNNAHVCNVSATMDGKSVATDLDWGGSTFNNIPAGATVEIIIYFEGVVENLQIMFDSAVYGDTNVYAGDVTISDIKLAKEGELVLPDDYTEPTEEPTQSSDPTEEPVPGEVEINGVNKVFAGNTETYKVSYIENTLNVKYSNVKGDSYLNINTQVTDITADKNVITLKITNNGSTAVKVRVDINSLTKVNNTYASNISATQDGNAVHTDTDWGGSMFTIAANSTSVCVIEFDTSRNTKELMIYFDSATYGDSNLFSGDVTISEIEFTTVE